MNNNEELMRNGSVWKAIFTMSLPAVVIILVMIFYNIADMFFIGQLGDANLVAAISVVGPVFSLLIAISMMLGNGGSTLIASSFGAGDISRCKRYSSLCFWTNLFASFLSMIALWRFANPLLHFLGATPEIMSYSKQYLLILTLGCPFLMTSNMLAITIKGEGSVKESFVGNILGTLINLVLDPILILQCSMGVIGAGLATVAGNLCASLYYLIVIRKRSQILSLDIKLLPASMKDLGKIISLGLPNAVGNVLSGFASTFSNQLLGLYGTASIAAMAAAGKVTMISGITTMAIVMGCQPLISFSYGAGNNKRLKEVLQKITLLTFLVGTALGAFSMLFRTNIIALFIQEESVLSTGVTMVTILLLTSPILGIAYIVTGYFQAIERPVEALIISFLRQGLFLIPALFLMNWVAGMSGIAWAYVIADVGATILSLLVYFKSR